MKRNGMIRKLVAILCAVALCSTAFLSFVEGVSAGADTAPPTGFTEIGWDDFGLEYKEYTAQTKGVYTTANTLHQTLLNDDITMKAGTKLRYAGSDEWQGIWIWLLADGRFVVNGGQGTFASAGYEKIYSASDFGLTTFIGTKFNLKISTEVSGNNYTFGVWINDKMAGDYFTLADAGNSAGSAVGIEPASATDSITLAQTVQKTDTPPTGFTEIGWDDFGLEYKEYTAQTKGVYTTANTLHQTLLNDDITMKAGTKLRYAGSDEWQGIWIWLLADGRFVVNGGQGTFASAGYEKIYSASDFGLTTFIGTKFNLKISTEVSGNNYTFGVWINDKMAGDYFTLADAGNSAGSAVGIEPASATDSITLVQVVTQPVNPPTPPAEEITPPSNFTELGWNDFGLSEGTQGLDKIGSYTAKSSLHQTVLNGDVTFGGATQLRYAAKGGWEGFIIYVLSDGRIEVSAGGYNSVKSGSENLGIYNASDFELTTFVGTKLNVKISTEVSGSDYTFGIWINDQILGGYFTLTDGRSIAGTDLVFYNSMSGKDVTLSGMATEPDNPGPGEPSIPPADFTEIKWSTLGLRCKEYPAIAGALAGKGTYAETLNQTLLNGDITLGAGTQIRYAGSDGWQGVIIGVTGEGVLYVDQGTFGTSYNKTYQAADYELTTFADTEFNLKISTEIDGDNYKFGVWVNDKMLGDYFTLAKGACITGNAFGMYDNGSNNSIILSGEPDNTPPTEPIPVPTDFTYVSLKDFGGTIQSGELLSGIALSGQLKGQDDFERTLFSADVNMTTNTPGNATYLRFAGTTEGWVGIGLESRAEGTLLLINWENADILQTFTTENAGVNFFETAFNLKMSFEYVDSDKDGEKDDVQVGVYFNDVLYNNEYVIVKNYTMTNWFLMHTDDAATHPLGVRNPGEKDAEPIYPDKGLKAISFSSFGLADADYTEVSTEDFNAYGSYRDMVKGKTLDGTLFHGKVRFSADGGTEIRYGGLESPWFGIRIVAQNDGTIAIAEAQYDLPEKQFTYIITPSKAKGTLLGEWLDLKISTQFVDSDGDGKNDDVKLGIWFNDILYQNDFFYLKDYAPHMGSYMGIYSSQEYGDIAIRSVEVEEAIDLLVYGFNNNYKSHFKNASKEKVVGVPNGVTVEYDTTDYELDTSVQVVETGGQDGNSVEDNEGSISAIVPVSIGVVVLAGLGLIVFILMRNKKKEVQ